MKTLIPHTTKYKTITTNNDLHTILLETALPWKIGSDCCATGDALVFWDAAMIVGIVVLPI